MRVYGRRAGFRAHSKTRNGALKLSGAERMICSSGSVPGNGATDPVSNIVNSMQKRRKTR